MKATKAKKAFKEDTIFSSKRLGDNMSLFDYRILARFRADMYDSLLYKHHLCRSTAKEVDFKDDLYPSLKAFFLEKENTLYLLPMGYFKDLPIRLKSKEQLTLKGGDVVELIKGYSSFKIIPVKSMTFREIVDIDNIIHSNPDAYTLWKIICWAARLERINLRICSNPEWGKTSYFKIMNFLVDKSYVITGIKTMPWFALGITEDGVLILDELSDIPSPIKKEIQGGLYQLGDMSPTLTLGSAGSASYKTKAKYDVNKLSCVCLYNNRDCYEEEKDFFDKMWSNSQAIVSRFMPLRLPPGKVDEEQFKVNPPELTEEVKQLYYKIIKSVEWYKDAHIALIKQDYISKTCREHCPHIKGRHGKSLLVIAGFIYLYCEENEPEYLKFLKMLNQWYEDYLAMMLTTDGKLNVEEVKI